MSPGPDFIVVMKNAIAGGKKAWLLTTLGISSGILVHATYCILGLGVIITKSILLFQTIKIAWALYLLYLSYALLKAKKTTQKDVVAMQTVAKTPREYIKEWFLVNLLNPKATIFILSLFTQVITPTSGRAMKFALGWEIFLITATWFSLVSYGINTNFIKRKIHSIKFYLEKVMWGILTLLGLKVLLSK
jgi:RhtB (resistance to homoserine/threonine) family protein